MNTQQEIVREKRCLQLTEEEMLSFARTVEPRVPLCIDIELAEGKSPVCEWDEKGIEQERARALKEYRERVLLGIRILNLTTEEAHDRADALAHTHTSGLDVDRWS